MSRDQYELAQAARAVADGPIDWAALVAAGVREYGMLMRFADRLYTFDFASIYQRYAEAVGTEPAGLMDFQKRQAIVNAVLEQA